MRLQVGDSLFRYYPEYQVWHTGIICYVSGESIDDVEVLEFDDSNTVSKVSLRKFMMGRKYFWVASYMEERIFYGNGVFRSERQKMAKALEKWRDCDITYTISNYNCEYFVRMCVFNDERLWKSTQTDFMTKSKSMIFLKMGTILLGSILDKANHSMEKEKNSLDRKNDHAFVVEGDLYRKM